MKKKYTMEEFEKMFDDAEIKALEKLDKQLEDVAKNELDGMKKFGFTMQNMMAILELKKQLFKEGE